MSRCDLRSGQTKAIKKTLQLAFGKCASFTGRHIPICEEHDRWYLANKKSRRCEVVVINVECDYLERITIVSTDAWESGKHRVRGAIPFSPEEYKRREASFEYLLFKGVVRNRGDRHSISCLSPAILYQDTLNKYWTIKNFYAIPTYYSKSGIA